MPESTDYELLAEFARSESEEAFAELVTRYVNLVYSAALRFTGNAHHAEEITQAVFVILARKAGKLSPRVVLSGWLYQTTRLTAANFVKAEIRRQRREQEAYMQSTLNDPGSAAWQQIAPLLEDAMGRLGETDRDAVVLRFFENKTAAEAASILKLTEAATHKRTNRALDKLRNFFSKHGVSSTTSIIAGAISAHSIQTAPAAVAHSVRILAAAKGVAASASTATLIQGALKVMAWTKAKTAIAAGIGVLLVAGTASLLVKQVQKHSDYSYFQGTWTGEEIGRGTSTITIRGSSLEYRGADPSDWYKGSFSFHSGSNPKQLVVQITECAIREYVGKTVHVIYRMQGDTLTIAGNEPGNPAVPVSFDAPDARTLTFTKKAAGTATRLATSPPADTANTSDTPATPEPVTTESIPGWGNVINPDSDCTLAFSDGKLTVDLPGTDHALMPERNRTNAPRVMQEVTGPFDVQVKVTRHFTPGAKTTVSGRNPYQDAGLLVWLDDKNNLKLACANTVVNGKSGLFLNMEYRHDGQRGELRFSKEATSLLRSPTIYLRLQIHSDQTTASVSGDGVKWFNTSLPGGGLPEKMQVGLIAENNTTSPLTIGFEGFTISNASGK